MEADIGPMLQPHYDLKQVLAKELIDDFNGMINSLSNAIAICVRDRLT